MASHTTAGPALTSRDIYETIEVEDKTRRFENGKAGRWGWKCFMMIGIVLTFFIISCLYSSPAYAGSSPPDKPASNADYAYTETAKELLLFYDWNIFAGVRNIFNGSYYWIDVFENPERWAEAGLRIQF